MTDDSRTISRRDFVRVAARYRMTSTRLAAGTRAAGATLSQLARAAEATGNRMLQPLEKERSL